MKKIIILFLSILILNSCIFSDKESIDKAQILDILKQIEYSFNQFDLEPIMKNYHPDFFHRGKTFYNEESVWIDRKVLYLNLLIDDIKITLDHNFAIVRMKVYFWEYHNEIPIQFIEPEINGDMSYFYFDDYIGEWKIFGNQQFE